MISTRQLFAWATVSILFILLLLASSHTSDSAWLDLRKSRTPDFSQYAPPAVLSAHEFPVDDRNKRVIVVGDVHGMDEKLQSLLLKTQYNPAQDVLIHVGDIVSKGSLNGSLAVLEFMSSRNITGVRGNHDQKVIEWKAWMQWIHTLPGGSQWLHSTRDKWVAAQANGEDNLARWLRKQERKNKGHKWWSKIPGKGAWVLFGEHFSIASKMTASQATYLSSLPLTVHIPSAHTYIVHAGLLPSNPRYSPYNRKQPLARVPLLPTSSRPQYTTTYNARKHNTTLDELRFLQESAILADVNQNTDPWVLVNMRSILKNNKITRTMDGTPWADRWNQENLLCRGYNSNSQIDPETTRKQALPCYPSTVLYGHAAGRGLDVNRFSFGLDSGCVYERRLTALVLGGSNAHRTEVEDDFVPSADGFRHSDVDVNRNKATMPFGDSSRAHLVSVSCK